MHLGSLDRYPLRFVVASRQGIVCAASALLALAAACGPSGSGGGGPTPTPASSATPVSSATPAPSGAAGIEPMVLRLPGEGASGSASGVNAREWISIEYVQPERSWLIALPPDAGPDAGPLPVPGCPLGADSPSCASGDSTPMLVGDSDWYTGFTPVSLPSFTVDFPGAFGPRGEIVLTTDCCGGTPRGFAAVLPVPGERFLGTVEPPDGETTSVQLPILWRTPGDVYEVLPVEGFRAGPQARAADAAGRIVGQGIDPALPVLWLPAGDGFELVVLPLLDGDTAGGAGGISDGRIAGWSGSGARVRAVVWEPQGGEAWLARTLPEPDQLGSCIAVAASGPRVAGNCRRANEDQRAVVWLYDGGAWRVETLLLPAPGISQSHVRALSGNLAVGHSVNQGGFSTAGAPVAWRLPARSQNEP